MTRWPTPVSGVPSAGGSHVAEPPSVARIPYRGGPIIESVHLSTIFWGTAWSHGVPRSMMGLVNQFYRTILRSAYMRQLWEYNRGLRHVAYGHFMGTVQVQTDPDALIPNDQIVSMLDAVWKGHADLPQPGFGSLYMIYLPPGITVQVDDSRQTGGNPLCAYHNIYDAIVVKDDEGAVTSRTPLAYGVIPYPCQACMEYHAIDHARNELTALSSHEMSEAITDPDLYVAPAWETEDLTEIGDVCQRSFKHVEGWLVQEEWSNVHSSCV